MASLVPAKITQREQQILLLIYKYRYLNRVQIQTFMGHKDKQPINAWLRDLLRKNYLVRDYSQTREDINKPAIYYSGLGAIRYFKEQPYSYPAVINRLYRDRKRTTEFIDKCIITADIAINFGQRLEWGTYETITPTICANPKSDLYFLYEWGVSPDLVIIRRNIGKAADSGAFFVLQRTTPMWRIKAILHTMSYLLRWAQWERHLKSDWPAISIICATKRQLVYARRLTSRGARDYSEDIRFHLLLGQDLK